MYHTKRSIAVRATPIFPTCRSARRCSTRFGAPPQHKALLRPQAPHIGVPSLPRCAGLPRAHASWLIIVLTLPPLSSRPPPTHRSVIAAALDQRDALSLQDDYRESAAVFDRPNGHAQAAAAGFTANYFASTLGSLTGDGALSGAGAENSSPSRRGGKGIDFTHGGGHRFGDSLLENASILQQRELHATSRGFGAASLSKLGNETLHFDQSGEVAGTGNALSNGLGRATQADFGSESAGGDSPTKLKVSFETLLYAVQNGDELLVTGWLEKMGERAAGVLNENPSLLNRAVFGQHENMVKLLLEANADPDANHAITLARPFGGEQWPLRLAVQHGYTEICRLLLQHSARLEAQVPRSTGIMSSMHTGDSEDAGSLLGAAAFKGHAEIVELLLDHHADCNGRGENGRLPQFLTPLMHAAYNGRDSVVALLLERKAQPNIGHDRQTHTALDFAEMQGNEGCVALLEAYRLPSLEELVTCLERADLTVLERWVDRGGGANHHFTAQMPEGRAQVPLLVYAAMKGQDVVVDWLLARSADPDAAIVGDPSTTEADGHTPLMRACIANHAKVVRKLLRAGAKIAQRSIRGQTALQLAEKSGHMACAREFKEHLLSVAEESRTVKQAQARERADSALQEAVMRITLMEEGSRGVSTTSHALLPLLPKAAAQQVLDAEAEAANGKPWPSPAMLLGELDLAIAAYNKDATPHGGSPMPAGTTSSSRAAQKLREKLQERLQASAREEAETALKGAIETSKAASGSAELQESLLALKAVINEHTEAASGSSLLKEARALRDKLGDAARKAKKQEDAKAKQSQREAQRKRDEALAAEEAAEREATAAHVAREVEAAAAEKAAAEKAAAEKAAAERAAAEKAAAQKTAAERAAAEKAAAEAAAKAEAEAKATAEAEAKAAKEVVLEADVPSKGRSSGEHGKAGGRGGGEGRDGSASSASSVANSISTNSGHPSRDAATPPPSGGKRGSSGDKESGKPASASSGSARGGKGGGGRGDRSGGGAGASPSAGTRNNSSSGELSREEARSRKLEEDAKARADNEAKTAAAVAAAATKEATTKEVAVAQTPATVPTPATAAPSAPAALSAASATTPSCDAAAPPASTAAPVKSTRFRKEAKEFIPSRSPALIATQSVAPPPMATTSPQLLAQQQLTASSQQQLPTPLLQPPQQPAHPQPPQPPQQVPVQPQPQLQPREAMQPQPTADPSLQQSSSTQPQSELNADASTRPPPSEVPPRPSSAPGAMPTSPSAVPVDSAAPPPTPPQPKPLFDAGDFPPPISVALGAAGKGGLPTDANSPPASPTSPKPPAQLPPPATPPATPPTKSDREADFPSLLGPGDPPPGGAPGAVSVAPSTPPKPAAMSWASKAASAAAIVPPPKQLPAAASVNGGQSLPGTTAGVTVGLQGAAGAGGNAVSPSMYSGTGMLGRPLPALPHRGLKNLGNTCFLNSVLQNLLATEQWRAFMLNGGGTEAAGDPASPKKAPQQDSLAAKGAKGGQLAVSKNGKKSVATSADASAGGEGGEGGEGAGGMTSAARRFFASMHGGGGGHGAIAPKSVLSAVSARHREFAGRAQQDSQEVLRHLLEGIRSEEVSRIQAANKARTEAEVAAHPPTAQTSQAGSSAGTASPAVRPPPAPDPPTAVDEIFGGELRSTVVCLQCKQLSCRHEPFLDLSLPIPTPPEDPKPGEEPKPGGVDALVAGVDALAHAEWSPMPTSPDECRSAAQCAIAAHLVSTVGGAPSAHGSLESSPNRKGNSSRGGGIGLEGTTSLSACLLEFLTPELLQGANAYECEVCQKAREEREEAEAKARKEAEPKAKNAEAEQLAEQLSAATPASSSPLSLADLRQPSRSWADEVEDEEEEAAGEAPASPTESSGPTTESAGPTTRSAAARAAAAKAAPAVAEAVPAPAKSAWGAPSGTASSGTAMGALASSGKRPPVRTDAIKLLQLTSAPSILTLHIKRFAAVGRTFKKVNCHVDFPMTLTIPEQFVSEDDVDAVPLITSAATKGVQPPSPRRDKPKSWAQLDPKCSRQRRFELFGVVEHTGTYKDGHYTAYVRVGGSAASSNGGSGEQASWNHYSDSKVTAVTPAQVLRAQAFLLFYTRLG